MTLEEVLISKSLTGKEYKIGGNPESFVRKDFSPTFFARLWNWFFYKSPHPLSTETGHAHAYWKRRLGSRLSQFISENSTVVDAVETSKNGFISPFIEGNKPTKDERPWVYTQTKTLEQVFDDIGMPTSSFSSSTNSGSNFIIQNGRVYIVNYEQSITIPDVRGHMGYDLIYFNDVHKFISDNRRQIEDKLGIVEMCHLEEAFELAKQYQEQLEIRPRRLTRFEEKFSKPLSKREMGAVVERLYRENQITEEEVEAYRSGKTGENIKLTLKNLAVHTVISLATPPYIMFGVSPILRAGWTIGNWGYYTIKRDYDKRRVHNLRVMIVASLPLQFPLSVIPAGAYLLPMMEENPQIGLAINDNLSRQFTGKSLEEVMYRIGSNRFFKPFVISYDYISRIRPVSWLQEKIIGYNTKIAHDILLEYFMEGARKNV